MPRDSASVASASFVALVALVALAARAGSRPREVLHPRAGEPGAAFWKRFESTLTPGCLGGA